MRETPFYERLAAVNSTHRRNNWAGYLVAERYQHVDIRYQDVVTALDIERKIGLSEGNIAGELLTPQIYLFRPAPGGISVGLQSTAIANVGPAPTWAGA